MSINVSELQQKVKAIIDLNQKMREEAEKLAKEKTQQTSQQQQSQQGA
jgi:hypothetical protein